jgi:hypothetical protein
MAELYAIALIQAETAATRYEHLAESDDQSFGPVQCVFEVLTQTERKRARTITLGSLSSRNKRPDAADLRWTPIDLMPAEELSDLGNSSLATAYDAWALAVRHRKRAFVFWTYVAALATDRAVQAAAEDVLPAQPGGTATCCGESEGWRGEPCGKPEARVGNPIRTCSA